MSVAADEDANNKLKGNGKVCGEIIQTTNTPPSSSSKNMYLGAVYFVIAMIIGLLPVIVGFVLTLCLGYHDADVFVLYGAICTYFVLSSVISMGLFGSQPHGWPL